MTNPISSYMSLIGQKGGKSGTGKSKKRDAAHYKKISEKGVTARKQKGKR